MRSTRIPPRLAVAAAACVLGVAAVSAPAQTTQPSATQAVAVPPVTAGSSDLGSPKATVKAFATAEVNGDGKTIHQVLLTNSPTEERMAGAFADLSVAIADLSRAMTAKFGPGPTQNVMGDPADALKSNLDKVDKADEKIDGDSATVISPGDPTPQGSMMLKKVGGQWKISVSDLAKGSSEANVQQTLASVDKAVAGYRTVLADLTAGKLASADDVSNALKAKMGDMPGGSAPGGAAPAGATPTAPMPTPAK